MDAVAGLMLKQFGVEGPFEDDVIFPEILNICAGNLATELKNRNREIAISPPENPYGFAPDTEDVRYIQIIADDCVMFKFCIYLTCL